MHLRGGEEAQGAAAEARPAATAQAEASAPWVVRESPSPAVPVRLPPVEMTPLFDPNMRLHLGESATLKFAAQDADRLARRGQVTASVFHGRDPERRLPVREVDPGVYEVPFQPYGPGQHQVVLSVGGVPAGSQKLGVIGAVGKSDGVVDIVDPLSVDPRDFRARTGGQFRRR
jgi:hypothetical protein